MNISVRAERVRVESLPIEKIELRGNDTRLVDLIAQPRMGLTSLATAIALGLGGILTLVWAGILVWLTGYLIGIW